MNPTPAYIPALGHHRLTPLYDPLFQRLFHEAAFKRRLVERLALQPGQRVLDLGCGTATLTIMLKQAQPAAEVLGLDGDPEVLDIGRGKAARAGAAVRLERGLATALPYPNGLFDRVVTSLMLHHLTTADKEQALAEAFRVLMPGGALYVLDIEAPRSAGERLLAFVARRLERAADNVDGRIPGMLQMAGFEPVTQVEHFGWLTGIVSATKPSRAREVR